MQNKVMNFGPVALTTTTTTDILNCAITSLTGPTGFTPSQPYIILRHVRILNKSSNPAKLYLYKGATNGNVAGTEVIGNGQTIPVFSAYDWYGSMRFDAADFLVGGSDTPTALVIQGEGEIGFV